jgi:hypothetical protein
VLRALRTVDESEPLDGIVGTARTVYALVRVAHRGMEGQVENRKFPSPLLNYCLKETTDAWNLARLPVDRAADGLPRAQYLAEAIGSLSTAIQKMERVLEVYR